MKNFVWTQFTKKIAIKAELSDIYNAWTKASEIEKWFLSNAVYFDNNNSIIDQNESIQNGYNYAWNWYLYPLTEKGKINVANGKDYIQFTFAGACLVDVELSVINDNVIVSLTQKNIPTDDDSKQNIRLGCHEGWSFYLVNLKSVYEGGIDLRNKNESLKAMMNN
jgi:hypothetical protein